MQEWHDNEREPQAPRRWSPAWIAATIIALLVMGLLIYGLASGATTEPPQIGDAVPGFQFTSFDGASMSLASQRGNVVVLNVFASRCGPCRQEAADLEQAWKTYQGMGVQFYGIAYKDADSKAKAFLDEFGVTYPSAIDRGNRTARAYGVTGVPETFVIDQSGQLVHHFLGAITVDQLSAKIDQTLLP